MPILRLSEIKSQLQLDEDHDDDAYLLRIGAAAEEFVSLYCNRAIVADAADLPDPADDPTAMVATPMLKQAMLLMAGTYFDNRESVTPLKTQEVPLGFKDNADFYRIRHL